MTSPANKQSPAANSKKMMVLVITIVVAMVALVGGGALLLSAMDKSDVGQVESGALVAPDAAKADNREWSGVMELNGEKLDVTLFGDRAPMAVASFLQLADADFFAGTKCHRLTTGGFDILQCGDPKGNGTGGPGYTFGPVENAPANNVYKRGTLAMARSSRPNSQGSQFFIVYGDTTIPSDANGGYTVFGEITGGLDAVDAIAKAGTANGQQDGPPAAPAVVGAMRFK